MVTSSLRATDKQPDAEICRVRLERVPSRAFVPVGLGCVTLEVWVCLPTWKLSEPPAYCWAFVEASSRRRDQLLTLSPALSLSLEDEGWS